MARVNANIQAGPTGGMRSLAGISTRAQAVGRMPVGDGKDILALLANTDALGGAGVAALTADLQCRLATESARHTRALNGATTLDVGSTIREVLRVSRGPVLADYTTRARLLWAASRALRQLLVEHAQECCDNGSRTEDGDQDGHTAGALSKGRMIFDERTICAVLELDSAIAALEAADSARAEVATCVLFGRMSVTEIAAALDCSAAIVRTHWALGQIWLHRHTVASAGRSDHSKPL